MIKLKYVIELNYSSYLTRHKFVRGINLKPLIVQILEEKGLRITEDKYAEMQNLFEFISYKKTMFDRNYLEDADLPIKNIAGGDHLYE